MYQGILEHVPNLSILKMYLSSNTVKLSFLLRPSYGDGEQQIYPPHNQQIQLIQSWEWERDKWTHLTHIAPLSVLSFQSKKRIL